MKKILEGYRQIETNKKIAKLEAAIEEMKVLKKSRSSDMTIGAQFLLLHYLNISLPAELNRNKKAALLKYLFNVEGDGNIKKYLSDIGRINSKESKEPFTIKNLERIQKIFEDLEMKKELATVEKDIKNKQS